MPGAISSSRAVPLRGKMVSGAISVSGDSAGRPAEAQHRHRTEARLRAQARALGFQLVPVIEQSVS